MGLFALSTNRLGVSESSRNDKRQRKRRVLSEARVRPATKPVVIQIANGTP
jgi:hypothetical protein